MLTSQEVIISYRAYRVMMVMCYFWLAKLTPDDLSAVMLNVFNFSFAVLLLGLLIHESYPVQDVSTNQSCLS